MKAIIFDVDGVIIKSEGNKKKVIKEIFEKHWLYHLEWVREILKLGVNRKLIVEKIAEIHNCDKEKLLFDLNDQLSKIAQKHSPNLPVLEFIKENHKNYLFFTNTALPLDNLETIFDNLDITKYFEKLLAFDTGTKRENVEQILNNYNLEPAEALFIDDNINHVNAVQPTGVKLLHFTDYDIDINNSL